MKWILAGIIFFSGILSWAGGDQIENGGDVIFCSSKAPVQTELLDMYEGRVTYEFNLTPAHGKTLAEIFEERVHTLDRWNPERAQIYREYFRSFAKEVKFLPPNNGFINIGDEGWATVPVGCELRQIVVQQDIPTPEGIRYFVNRDLWDQLSEESKAALLLHEFIYREGRQPRNNFRNSSGVRYFNALIHSDKMPQMTLHQYLDNLRFVGFQNAEAQGEPIALYNWNKDFTLKTQQEILYHSDNVVGKASLTENFRLLQAGQLQDISTCHNVIDGEHEVWFYEDGRVSTITIGCEPQAQRFSSKTGQGFIFGSTFSYDSAGVLHSISHMNDRGYDRATVFSYASPDYQLLYFAGQIGSIDVLFYPNGAPMEVSESYGALSGWLNFQGKHLNQNELLLHQGVIVFTDDGKISSIPNP